MILYQLPRHRTPVFTILFVPVIAAWGVLIAVGGSTLDLWISGRLGVPTGVDGGHYLAGMVIAFQLWLVWLSMSAGKLIVRMLILGFIVTLSASGRTMCVDIGPQRAILSSLATTSLFLLMTLAVELPRWKFRVLRPSVSTGAAPRLPRQFSIRGTMILTAVFGVGAAIVRVTAIPIGSAAYWGLMMIVWITTTAGGLTSFFAATRRSLAGMLAAAVLTVVICLATAGVLILFDAIAVRRSAAGTGPSINGAGAAFYINVYSGFAATILALGVMTRLQSVTIDTTGPSRVPVATDATDSATA